jgi:hypothetical protein
MDQAQLQGFLEEPLELTHNYSDEYFLYVHTTGSPGVLQSLSKARTMLAVRLNGTH